MGGGGWGVRRVQRVEGEEEQGTRLSRPITQIRRRDRRRALVRRVPRMHKAQNLSNS
ncbi:hypothetical protein SLEP1_g24477 [Rubroshorea leprosula]|uniref:Uncharacterized protein n=1 Tax=Rubroshorea leprosula TaxID=152421 RepID=A0AAV5JN51_9ROSI|nr:hypothetical protein SLEP1_g24477 [Rubroshorea leprosula]